MHILERVRRLRNPIKCAGAAIDAARCLARITGEPHTLYYGDGTWIARATDEPAPAGMDRAGGVYRETDERSRMQTDPRLTPELAAERGVSLIGQNEYDQPSCPWRVAFELAKVAAKCKGFTPQTRYNHYIDTARDRFLDRE